MASITPASDGTPDRFRHRLRRTLATLLLLLLPAAPATSADTPHAFRIVEASLADRDGRLRLDADLEYRLSDDALEALDNGVALTFVVEIEVQRRWLGFWPRTVLQLEQRYQLSYRALSGQYTVAELDRDEQRNYPSRGAAIEALGTIRGLAVADAGRLAKGHHSGRIRTFLDIDNLPLPLRPTAYLSAGWQLESAWHRWPITR